jgi:hypothetical protein
MLLNRLLEKRSSQNTTEVTTRFIKSIKVPVTAATVIKEVEGHPDFPSLYSISDSLSKWKVDNIAINRKG